jgi:16S rRNA (cytosine1402-N4)-methyltransferase
MKNNTHTENNTTYHIPVLKNEILEYFVTKETGIYVDATVGGGGHSLALLEKFPHIQIIACDWDYTAICEVTKKFEQYADRTMIIHSSFATLSQKLHERGIDQVDGILADFGTSQYQIFHQPGFSFRYDSYLDMRMSNGFTQTTAADIIRHASEAELAHIFYQFGQETQSRKIARKIVEERAIRPIKTSLHLATLIAELIPRKGKIHPATKVFQALRIAVNKELEQIQSLLFQVPKLLAVNGRLACISFHSLEDALVKYFMQTNKQDYKIIGPDKIITPTKEEIALNPASRSSKLRILEKIK